MNAARNNIPRQLSSFVGRERELAAVTGLLRTTRLVTLTGAGGCGKTALALRVATELLGSYRDGAWWVELAPLTDPALVSQAIAKTLGLEESANRGLSDALVDYLHDKELLLVLDNCEHLIESCAEVAILLLHQCPDLRILATSREALNIPGEVAWIVPSLEFPAPDSPLSVANLRQYDAVRLFVDRASAVRSDFALVPQNASAVAEICRQVDGIPLAIELAAALVQVLSAGQIAGRLDDAMQLLTGGKRGAPQRHQTLRATMDWSHELLTPAEQILFRRLAVFAGGLTLSAAEAVCADAGLPREEILSALTHLVDKSLLVKEELGPEARYRMLEPVRQYALQKLEESGEAETIRNSHLRYFLKLAEEAEPKLTSVERDIWRQRLEADYDNLRTALQRSQTVADSEIMARLAGALTWLWFHGNYQSEGRHWLERALVRIEGSKSRTAAHALALFGAGRLATAVGPFHLASVRLTKSVGIFKELADWRHAAYALVSEGYILLEDGEYAKGRARCAESVEISRNLGDNWLLAFALTGLGQILADSNSPDARAVFAEALRLAHTQDDKLLTARILGYLSEVDLREGDFARARERRQEMLALFRALRSKHGTAWALLGLGEVARSEGDLGEAEELYEESRALFHEVGLSLASPLYGLGAVAQLRGDAPRAWDLFKQSLRARQQDGAKQGVAEALAGLAGVAAEVGQPLIAARFFGAAEAVREAIEIDIRPYNRAPYDRYLPLARAGVSQHAFAAAWAEGRGMTLEQALAEAEPITLALGVAPAAPLDPHGLTAREREVLRLLARGLSNAQISEKLIISPRTVNTHLTAIYGKLGVNSRAAATRYALDHHLL